MQPQSEHLESVKILLEEVPTALSALQAEYMDCVTHMKVSSKFRVQTQAFLGHLRSILDFLANEVACFCSRKPKKIYFPIAKVGLTKEKFENNLENEWMPGLKVNRPDIFDFLSKLQHFYPGNDWLPAFHELSNKNKHIRLSKMAITGCDAMVIKFYGTMMQFGDRGYSQGKIEVGASLVFQSGSRRAVIRGPQTLDRNTRNLLDADAGLEVIHATWTEFKFDEFPHQPAIVFLETALREVGRISNRIGALI